MNTAEAKQAILDMTIEELIDFVNDTIDPYEFPLSQIKSIEDDDMWEKIGEDYGGYLLERMLFKSPRKDTDKWFILDSEDSTITFYPDDKDAIIRDFGIDRLIEEYIEMYS